MALTAINPGVRVQQIEVSAPDESGQVNVTMRFTMRSGYNTRPGAETLSTPTPAAEGALNTLIGVVNDDYTDYTA